MRNISHPAFQFHPAEMLKMDAVITENLSEICTSKVIGGRCTLPPLGFLGEILLKISRLPIPDPLDLCSTLHLVLITLVDYKGFLTVTALKEPRTAMPEEVWKGLEEDVGVFPSRLEEMTKAFEGTDFPSFKDLLKIICGGSLVQDCTFCASETRIEAFGVGREFSGVPCVTLPLYRTPMIVCTDKSCREQMRNILDLDVPWAAARSATYAKLLPNKCDFCFKRSEKVHRFVKCGRVIRILLGGRKLEICSLN